MAQAHILARSGLEEVLKCSLCSDMLIPPTSICKNGHTVCHDCNSSACQQPDCSELLHKNPVLDKVITITEFPCSNQVIGCPKIIRYDNLINHTAKECEFRFFKCVMGLAGKKCNESIFRDNYAQHLQNCRYNACVEKIEMNDEISRKKDFSQYPGKPLLIQTVLKIQNLYFIETLYYDKSLRELFVCYQFVGKNSHSKKYKYTIKLHQDSVKALTLTCPCLPLTNSSHDIKKDIRCVVVDPSKFISSSGLLNYSFKIEKC